MLKLALKNTKIYCRKVYNNIDDLEKAINDSNTNYISVSFPKATMIKTKKRRTRFCPKSTINHGKTPNINNSGIIEKTK